VAVLAIDPGTTESGWVLLDSEGEPSGFGKEANEFVLALVYDYAEDRANLGGTLAVEMVASYGMAVGAEVFETCVWAGRFIEAWGGGEIRVYRRDVKLHLCGQTRAKDGNVRQALIDRYGGKDKAIGKKASPGPCYGMSGDVWQALALAVTVHDGAVS
jgi:hypothetical protein